MYEIKLLKDALDKVKPSCLDDVVDKAHYLVTSGVLIVICLIVSAKQIFGEPISCMIPPEFPKAWVSYVNEYCFVTNTFVMKNRSDYMPQDEIVDDMKIDVSYYQWIPYVLAVQAFFFFAPHLFWMLFQKTQTDVDFDHLVGKCVKSRELIASKKDEEIDDVVLDIVQTCEHRHAKNKRTGLGSLGMIAYTAAKLMNIANVLLQLFLLNRFLGNAGWGMELIDSAAEGVDWNQTGFFPRVSMCTLKKNALSNVQTHTVQCVLMMNTLYEKIFMILYVWLIVLLIASVTSAFYTFVRYVSPLGQRHSARRYLKTHPNSDRVEWRKFADHQLEHDGLLLLRFIENSAGFLIASQVACRFYDSLRQSAIRLQCGLNSSDDDGGKKKLLDAHSTEKDIPSCSSTS